jgi:hypothetical protein
MKYYPASLTACVGGDLRRRIMPAVSVGGRLRDRSLHGGRVPGSNLR